MSTQARPTAPLPSDCEHADDPYLRRFRWEHPELLCARCWFAGRPVARGLDGEMVAFVRPPRRESHDRE